MYAVDAVGPGISNTLDGLETAVDDLNQSAGSSDGEEIRRAAEVVLSWIRSLNQDLPSDLKKGAFRKLQQHVRFVEVYLERGDLGMVRSNIRSLKPEMTRLRSACARATSTQGDLEANLDEVPPGPYKLMLTESCRCFNVGAYSAAVVSAVSSLEGLYRDIYRREIKDEPGRMDFKRVIDELERRGHLKGLEEPLLQVARIYRNFSAHPSRLAPDREETKTIIQFAFAKLKVKPKRR